MSSKPSRIEATNDVRTLVRDVRTFLADAPNFSLLTFCLVYIPHHMTDEEIKIWPPDVVPDDSRTKVYSLMSPMDDARANTFLEKSTVNVPVPLGYAGKWEFPGGFSNNGILPYSIGVFTFQKRGSHMVQCAVGLGYIIDKQDITLQNFDNDFSNYTWSKFFRDKNAFEPGTMYWNERQTIEPDGIRRVDGKTEDEWARESIPYLGKHILQIYKSLGRYFDCKRFLISQPRGYAYTYYEQEGFRIDTDGYLALRLQGGKLARDSRRHKMKR
jgi:hypothetical protein